MAVENEWVSRQIQQNLIAYMRLFANLPGIAMHDDPETFWLVSNRPAPGNVILRAQWPPDRTEERIDALFAHIARHSDHIDWLLFPHDRPADLGNRLEARGMPAGTGGHWLWADLTSLGPAPAHPPNLRIEPVRNDQQLAEWVHASESGFGVELGCFYAATHRQGYASHAPLQRFTGYLNDTPVTSGAILEAGACAAIYDLSTPPPYRRQGLAGALTHALMTEIRNRGYTHTWIWASNVAQSLYRSLGYVDADFGVREHSWQIGQSEEAKTLRRSDEHV